MDIGSASGAPIKVEIDGSTVEFGRLTMSDFGKLQSAIELDAADPRGSRAFITMFDTYSWCTTPQGVVPFLLASRQKVDAKAKATDIESLSTPFTLYKVANQIVNEMVGVASSDDDDGGGDDADPPTPPATETG